MAHDTFHKANYNETETSVTENISSIQQNDSFKNANYETETTEISMKEEGIIATVSPNQVIFTSIKFVVIQF